VFINEKTCSVSALHTGIDMTNESNCGAFGRQLSAIRTILHHLPVTEFAWIYHSETIQVQA
jgi:hypothetical protein